MPARILIQSGTSLGTSHWIEKNVVRIGSDPISDLVIPSAAVDAHALTVEYRQTGYRVYNRGTGVVLLSGSVLKPNQHADWIDSDLLELQDGVSLALEIDSDPSPSPPPSNSFRELPNPETSDSDQSTAGAKHTATPPTPSTGAKTSTSASRTAFQLVVTAACLLGCVGLILREQIRNRSETAFATPGLVVPPFESVVEQALKAESSVPSEVLDKLQMAEAALVRGQVATARSRYQKLYDHLSHLVQSAATTNAEAPSELESIQLLIQQRLQRLHDL